MFKVKVKNRYIISVSIECVYRNLSAKVCHRVSILYLRENLNGLFVVGKWLKSSYFRGVVPPGGFEPPRPKASDFESDVSTDFTTAAWRGRNYRRNLLKAG